MAEITSRCPIQIPCYGGVGFIFNPTLNESKMNPGLYVARPRLRSRGSLTYDLTKHLIVLHANTCRCGSKRLYMEDCVHFVRVNCSVCGNKTDAFYKKDEVFRYISGEKWRKENFKLMREAVAAWNRAEYRDWRDEYEDVCAKRPLSGKFRTPKLQSDEHYREMLTKKSPKDFYVDQAMRQTYAPGFYFGSAFTPHGISILDNWYCLCIRELGLPNARFKYTAAQLEKMILKNVHLHEIIKWNLIGNLRNYAVL